MLARAAVLAVWSEPHGQILGKHRGENESDSMPCSRSRSIYGEHVIPNAITTNVLAGAPGHPRWRGEEVRQRLREKLRAQALERREERFKADDLAAARAAWAPVSDSTTSNVAAYAPGHPRWRVMETLAILCYVVYAVVFSARRSQ